jgi:hypothetical protein
MILIDKKLIIKQIIIQIKKAKKFLSLINQILIHSKINYRVLCKINKINNNILIKLNIK